ncbi:6819_t:CDS:1, partial [Racocetra persica]
TATNHQDQNNNETPHDIPNSERRYDMACLKFLSSFTNLGLILRACASWSSIMLILGL